LKDTPEQKVEIKSASASPTGVEASEGSASTQQVVVIEPAQQNTVYVPQYDPTTAYGAPVAAPAGYTGTEMLTTGLISFGLGMGLMALINDGDDDWDCGWHGGGGGGGGTINYNKNVYRNRGNSYPRAGRSDGREARRQEGSRPTPYSGRGGQPLNPSSRPYNPSAAKPFRPGSGAITKPVFPQATTLPNRGAMGARTPGRQGGLQGDPGRQQGFGQERRGYGANAPNRATRGGGNGAFGGYAPGGATQAAGRRGRSSLGGGGAMRGGGGSGGRRGGGGGRRGGDRKGRR